MSVTTALWEPGWEDCLGPRVGDQPRQQDPVSTKKLIGHGGVHLWLFVSWSSGLQ